MIDKETIRQFHRRLNHTDYGVTEVVTLHKDSGKLIATGFFDDETSLLSACGSYNEGCNIYAGRNPRPPHFSVHLNKMDTVNRTRAKDRDIRYLTAISFDIDPIRKKGLPATAKQHHTAISFVQDMQWDLGGWVDDSGNGAYLWLPFLTPIEITPENFLPVKRKCEAWHASIKRRYAPSKYGLRIDGCFDFSRIKRVIGTFNHKAKRLSGIIRIGEASDTVRDAILSIDAEKRKRSPCLEILPAAELPKKFRYLLAFDVEVKELWNNPDPQDDRSKHDWMLGMACVEAGITDPSELAAILMANPYGKYQRDGREGYVRRTVGKLITHK